MNPIRPLALGAAVAALLALNSCNSSPTTAPPGGGGAELGSPTISANGGTFSHIFNTAGAFPYMCTIHPGCTGLFGTVVVVSAGTPIAGSATSITQAIGGSCYMLSMPTDTVHVGETVTWTNNSPVPHNVTSH